MTKRGKKGLSLLLTCLLIAMACLQNTATLHAGEIHFLDVTTDNACLREGPSKDYSEISRTYYGRVLKVVGKETNDYGNLWYEVAWEQEAGDGRTAYIYSKNVEKHEHGYFCVDLEGVEYHACSCGDVYVEEEETVTVSRADTLVLGATVTAGATSVADGPFPFGEAVGALILAGAYCLEYSGAIPDEVSKITTKTDFSDYIDENGEVCGESNFRMVAREGGNLVVISDKCLNLPQAFVYSRFCYGDVWTPDESGAMAMACAAMNKDFFGPEVDKNKPGYYYHYHYGTDHNNCYGGHVFYGKGQFTGSLPIME